jgi:hypothetical protein
MSARGGGPFGTRLVAGDVDRLRGIGQLATGSFNSGHATSLEIRILGLAV